MNAISVLMNSNAAAAEQARNGSRGTGGDGPRARERARIEREILDPFAACTMDWPGLLDSLLAEALDFLVAAQGSSADAPAQDAALSDMAERSIDFARHMTRGMPGSSGTGPADNR